MTMGISISLNYSAAGNRSSTEIWRNRLKKRDTVFRLESKGQGSRWRQSLWRGDTKAQFHSLLFSPQIYALGYALKWRVISTRDWEMVPSALVLNLNVAFLVCYLKGMDTISLIFIYRSNTKWKHSHWLTVFCLCLRWCFTLDGFSLAEK